VLEPAIGEGEVRALPLKVAGELAQERSREGWIGARHVGQHQHQVSGIAFDHLHHALRPVICQVAVAPLGSHARRHPPQVFDQRQPQHDRDRPELAQVQRMDRFIRGDEAVQAVGFDPAIHVGDQLQGHRIGPRIASVRAARQPRQLPAVGRRQVSSGEPDLIFDEIEVVQQPFCRRGDPSLARHGGGHQMVGLDQDLLVLVQPRNQLVSAALGRDLVSGRQLGGMPRQLIDAEELRPERLLVFRRSARAIRGAGPSPEGSHAPPRGARCG
jgi:hypothetical protein